MKVIIALAAACLLAGCAAAPGKLRITDEARRELAPTGKLRAGMNTSNILFTRRDAASGELYGVSVDVMRELAARLGVPLELVVHPTAGEVADSAGRGTWDVAVLAIEPARAKEIAFTAPMTEIEATYVVRADSALRSVEQVDAAGVRIAVPARAGYDLYLTRTLRNATLVRGRNFDETVSLFNKREVEALANLRPALLENRHRFPEGRLLEGRFMTVNHGLGTPQGRPAGAAWLAAFAEELRRSGFLERSIARYRVQGLAALP